MTDLLPTSTHFMHHMVNDCMRRVGFAPPDSPPLCTADLIDTRETKPIRVLCLGMPRTGTMSLGAALDMLGYSTYNHVLACVYGYRDMRCWNEALDAKFFAGGGGKGRRKRYGRREFEKILRGFDVVADGPAVPYFSEDLIEAFPDAKVILTERPVDNWVKSIANTVAITFTWPTWHLIAWADESTSHWWGEAVRMSKLSPHWRDARSADQRLIRAEYARYYERIRELVPKERLLEFKLGETGWKELCEFLGEKEPPEGTPYPYVNESKTFVPMFECWYWAVFRIAARKVLTRGLVAFVAAWVVWRRRRLVPGLLRRLREFLLY